MFVFQDLRTVLAVLSQFSGVSSKLKSFLVECALHIMLQQVCGCLEREREREREKEGERGI